jgi:hypothetical protein
MPAARPGGCCAPCVRPVQRLAIGRRHRCRQNGPVRLCKNVIQECDQFGRSQDGSYSYSGRAPGLDHRTPAQPPVPAGQPVLAARRPDPRPGALPRQQAGQPARPGAAALTDPVGAGAQRAAQFPGAAQVAAVPRPQGEVLRLTRPVVTAPRRGGEPVIGVGPELSLLRVMPGGPDALGELGQPVATALPHGGKRLGVPGQLQGDLIGLARPVPARDRSHRQDRAINTA